MGGAARSGSARRSALTTLTRTRSPARQRVAVDLLVLLGIIAVVVAAGALRREFLGDGVRHLPAIVSAHVSFGEPRWLLFPALAGIWVRFLSAIGMVDGVESVLAALVALSIAAGVLFLISLRIWLRAESEDDARRAAALLLAGSCAPFLILFSDIAEPQVAAALAIAGLAYARVRRDDVRRARGGMLVAVGAIAAASLIYEAMILALGMLPLVTSTQAISRRRVLLTGGTAVVLVAAVLIVAQVSTGTSVLAATTAVVQGEHNPLTRSLMATTSLWKYVAAILAGPPQGIISLKNFSGLPALASLFARGEPTAIVSVVLLLVGVAITGMLLIEGVRDRQWHVLAAAAILLALPVVRNQQYAYVKFYVLWPIPVALLAIRCRARTIFTAATLALAANGWLVADQISHGRDNYGAARAAYAGATPSTCWLTSGWTPPFAYLWPGRAAPILGTLATGTHPDVQRAALSAALRRCLCDADKVWTDTTSRDAEVVRTIARHFEYADVDLASVLIDPKEGDGNPLPGVLIYSDAASRRACRAASR